MEHIINPDSAERDAATVEYDGTQQYMLTQENEDPLQNLLDKNNQEWVRFKEVCSAAFSASWTDI